MFKKILSLALVAMLLMSVCAVSFSAAQVEVSADGAASAVAEQGADGDVASQGNEGDVASTGADTIKYDNSGTNWAGPIKFYIYDVETGAELKPWGSKQLDGTDEGNNIWSKDVSGYGIESGKQYCIIFHDGASNAQTYDLMMDTTCYGDTAVLTGKEIENPVDSNKKTKETKWTNNSLGSRKQVTSIGNVVGETLPANESAYDTFVNFLKNTLDNARQYSGKDDQALIDDTAKALGIGKSDVEKAIGEANVTTEWSKDKSSLADESDAGANDKGSDSSNDTGSSDTGSSDTGSNGSNGSTGSSSSSSSKSGSASNTQTGQTETVLFIMLGVMVAAAGVIFFARKKERA